MTKKNQAFSWRRAQDEELGFMGNPSPIEHGENSGVGEAQPPAVGSGSGSINRVPLGNNSNCCGDLQTGSARTELTTNRILANDELYLSLTDHPGMNLTSDLFDGKNYHNWCRAIHRGLLSCNKLGLIDGSVLAPRRGSIDYMQWLKVDYIVFIWITNSMVKEVGRSFQNLDTSRQLWKELERRFRKKNGPRVYKLRREIATFTQHTQTVMVYFNNLNALWNDLALLKTSKPYTCEALEDAMADLEGEHLMQFLMGLNDCYETIRQQILIQNPLPMVSQAYGMILQVEDQINVSTQFLDNIEHSVLLSNQRTAYKGEGFKKRLSKEEKLKLRCEHCGGKRHLKTECFELIEIPEWYKKFKSEKTKGKAVMNVMD
ncbi:hypothetical protein C2S51_020028 [Perilla frutescens var. frutescens]|nr:hypothetical protein C2S51_020028 [Perilla frutescens var. frutescens]